jgi:energy-coupling factor transporter transmembrane protein EcfT
MELRGYDPEAKRTRYQILLWKKRDTITIVLAISYIIIAISYKIFG